MTEPPDEFAWIDRLKPLSRGDSRALGLADDAAVIPGREGYELVVSVDGMVEGVHFLVGEAPDVIAKRLLRTSLSDLAAKTAEPFGYFLLTAWPNDRSWDYRDAFIQGLAEDGKAFGVALLGGDTVGTPGPMTVSATVMGWCPKGQVLLRSGALAGDLLMVCGVIGDGWLGLRAACGEIDDPSGCLASHYRTPRPLFELRPLLRQWARAAADVSDGLVADAGHLARASGLGLELDLALMPISPGGLAWCATKGNQTDAILALATGGDDYAIVCAVDPRDELDFKRGAAALGVPAATVGVFDTASDVRLRVGDQAARAAKPGWSH